MLRDLILHNRSYRRFDQSHMISKDELISMVELARFSASARNAQPLKYILSFERERNEKIFPCFSWAGYLKDWPGPEEGERPSAYIIMVGDTRISGSYSIDPGIAAQSILLGATEKGLGGCIIATINKTQLQNVLNVPTQYEILYVLALGKPIEKVILEELPENGEIMYWRDTEKIHHVPKRSLKDLILEL